MGDYTRDTFRPSRNYSAVRQQQGRVHMDADWNELVDIGHHVARTTTSDVVGPTGMPEAAPGFALIPVPAAPGSDLLIDAGRAYIDGIFVEHAIETTDLTLISGADAAAIWEVTRGPRLAAGQWVGALPDPMSALARVAAIEAPIQGDNGRQRLTFETSMGADPTLSVQGFASVNHQPYLRGTVLGGQNNTYLAYLDVFEREISALEDALIAETALNGSDTAIRTQVVWQVKSMSLQGFNPSPPTCKSFPPGWSPEPGAPMLLSAVAHKETAQDNPCELPEQGGYRSLLNQLYRIEVHSGGIAGTDKIWLKWSRDNGIHRSRLLDVANGSLVVENTGNDRPTAFATDQWLEVLDEGRILRGEPGHFVEIGEVIGSRLGIRTILDPLTLQQLIQNGAPNTGVLPTRGLVRRWEGGQPQEVTVGTPLVIERGIEVTVPLAGGRAAPGMYWLIPARTLTADIEWPADDATGASAALPPHGVRHAYCALAILTKNNTGWKVVSDCRPIFPPLTKLEEFFYLGGDGQEAMPDPTTPAELAPLNSPLRVGVARGRRPVKGRAVRFKVMDAAPLGALVAVAGPGSGAVISATSTEVVLTTGDDGVAAVNFSIPYSRHNNHVSAELLDSMAPAQASTVHLPIQFTANTSLAANVGFDPANCKYQWHSAIGGTPSKTVQQAIDRLCPRLELVLIGGDSQLLCKSEKSKRPLQVAVFWGKQPLEAVTVEFAIVNGDAALTDSAPLTNSEGIAETYIEAGIDDTLNEGFVEVVAKVSDPPGFASIPSSLTFGARFLHAHCVYGGGGTDDAIHVKGISIAISEHSPEMALNAYDTVTGVELARGVVFYLDREVDPGSIKRGPCGDVLLNLAIGYDRERLIAWQEHNEMSRVAWGPSKLYGSLRIYRDEEGEYPDRLLFTFEKQSQEWLTRKLNRYLEMIKADYLDAEAVLYGNRIHTPGEGDERVLYLDGDLFINRSGTVFPSGDGLRGGDLSLPFFVRSNPILIPVEDSDRER